MIIMSTYSNKTFWEFKKIVAEKCGLSPKYLKLQRSNSHAIKDIEHGKTLAELGF